MLEFLEHEIQKTKELYLTDYRRMVSYYNQEKATIKDYNGRQLLELIQNADDSGSSNVYPNPAAYNTTIEYQIKDPTTIRLSSYTATGHLLPVLEENVFKNNGIYQSYFNADNLIMGVYYVQLSTKDNVKCKKIVMTKNH